MEVLLLGPEQGTRSVLIVKDATNNPHQDGAGLPHAILTTRIRREYLSLTPIAELCISQCPQEIYVHNNQKTKQKLNRISDFYNLRLLQKPNNENKEHNDNTSNIHYR